MIAQVLLLCVAAPSPTEELTPAALKVGQWVELRGHTRDDSVFAASKVEIMAPEEYETLTGTVTDVLTKGSRFLVLGQQVHTGSKTEWGDVDPDSILGQRLKIEGRYHGPRKFSARKIRKRNEGRDRLGGRIDALERDGAGWTLVVMNRAVSVSADTEVESESPLAEVRLAPRRTAHTNIAARNEDDIFGKGVRFGEHLVVNGQLEFVSDSERDFNLDPDDLEDREDTGLSARIRGTWDLGRDLEGVTSVRVNQLWRDDEDDGSSTNSRINMGETYLRWTGLAGDRLEAHVGRLDFDDPREWLYDQNLDALRGVYADGPWRAELSSSTTLFEGSDRDEAATNWIAYVSHGDEDRALAGYVVHRDFDLMTSESLTHFGARALGEWVDGHESWFELSAVSGSRGSVDVDGWAYDIGTTWSPEVLEPFYLTAGYALGSGDDDPALAKDKSYRQTGLQDNNGRFGGVTSFRYYGELFDPELSNMGISTLGVGAKLGRRSSLDLVFHDYQQDVVAGSLTDTGIDANPNGTSGSLGWEVDLIFGTRHWDSWDVEIVMAHFEPGAAFDEVESASSFKVQVRYRF